MILLWVYIPLAVLSEAILFNATRGSGSGMLGCLLLASGWLGIGMVLLS